MSATLLEVRDLSITLNTAQGELVAVEQVDFDLLEGEIIGLVGESGSGKSMILRAILGLLPGTARVTGNFVWRGHQLGTPGGPTIEQIRGRELGMVFQDPMTALNPLRRIGSQLAEVPRRVLGWSAAETRARLPEMLEQVGISDPARVLRSFPHELSGGMRQRVLIAMAFACEPALVLCDEPTTALDVTIQAQILDLIRRRSEEVGSAMIFVSHDLAVVDQLCSGVQVLYAGQVVERGPIAEVFSDPRHAYTAALLASLPRIDSERRRPVSIPGEPPARFGRETGCRFHRRCIVAGEHCLDEDFGLRVVNGEGLGTRLPGRQAGILERGSACYYDRGIPEVGAGLRNAVREAS